MTTTDPQSGYAPVNGLDMYYEVHGTGRPLVLLHGALSTTSVDFGAVLPSLAKARQVIAVEQQAHGHTADIDRPLTTELMAADTAALLRQLGIDQADVFGYSMGAGIALQMAIEHPDLVRKLAVASAAYTHDGLHPGLLEGLEQLTPEALAGTPFEQAYAREAPNPEAWPTLVAKVKVLNSQIPEWPADAIRLCRRRRDTCACRGTGSPTRCSAKARPTSCWPPGASATSTSPGKTPGSRCSIARWHRSAG
jgi:pimeloyl-ACP methyl ester carboxylesterase